MSATIAKIAESLLGIKRLRDSGQMTVALYNKCAISLAYEFANAGEVSRATAALQTIPLDHLRDVLPKDMADDPEFCEKALELARYLIKAGVASLGAKVRPNMPAAAA